MSSPDRFLFVLFDGFSNHCLANCVEPLRAANTIAGRTLFEWQFATVDGQGVESSSGLPVSPHTALKNASGDIVFAMPSYGYRSYCTPPVIRGLRSAARRFAKLGGLDTGSWLLAQAHLLDGYQATIHWEEYDNFRDTFPDVYARKVRFVTDRDRITCSGASAGFDMTLDLITEQHGVHISSDVAKLFMNNTPQHAGKNAYFGRDRLVRAMLNIMNENLESPITISEIATALGCSPRKLELRVKAACGNSPNAMYTRLRMSLARKLLQETDLRVSEIAPSCGYESASALSRAFKREFGFTPGTLRAASY